ncbi:MAG: transglutaminase domain-containing protein [Clostridia bacterium]|nr:transglutaminase domain-containing protein [Clostridia bacterium]
MERRQLSRPVVELKGRSRNMRRKRRRRLRPGFVAFLFIFSFLIVGLTVFLILYNSRVYSRVEVEAGDVVLTPADFSKNGSEVSFDPSFSPDSVDFHTPGEYPVKLRSGIFRYTVSLTVKDTVPPVARAVSKTVSRGITCAPEDLVDEMKDETKVLYTFETEPDFSTPGVKKVTVILTDLGGNVTRVTADLTVIPLYTVLEREAGSEAPSPADFVLPGETVTELSLVEETESGTVPSLADLVRTPGDHPIRFLADGLVCDCVLRVNDTTPPVMTLRDVTCGVGVEVKPELFVAEVKDAGEVLFSVELSAPSDQPGTQRVTVRAKDAAGNESAGEATLTLMVDTAAPEIHGGESLFAYVGKTVSFLSEVQVRDDLDPAPTIEVDSSGVNLKQEGTYPVVYIATDAAGNRAEKRVQITVFREQYSEEEVLATAGKILEGVLKPGMSDREKVDAIYYWIRAHVSYRDSDTIHDWLLAAHQGLVNHWGDCSVFQMTSRALLTAAGIENRLIDTLPLYEMHCWNLVNIGEGWYHFDTTAFFTGSNFCYVDTATLLNRSGGFMSSHTFDRDRYPDVM